jgi:outer membrane receptor for ferrienterochelin and colicin
VVAPQVVAPSLRTNYTYAEIDGLASLRTLTGITRLAPGVSDAVQTPGPTVGQGQVAINGSFGYDNVFMVNGVDASDNIFGWPQNLFIEEAIAETQVLTSGVSAEYGRFGGGVVNAITRSGGNTFSGSYRVNLANDAWSTETPFERARGVTRVSRVNAVHESTFGGPVVRDRLWFFLAGRHAAVETSATLPVTGAQYQTKDGNQRGNGPKTSRKAVKPAEVQIGKPRKNWAYNPPFRIDVVPDIEQSWEAEINSRNAPDSQ